MKAVLLLVGVVAEFAGIVLLGFPDFVPGAIRLSGWLRRTARRIENRLRRLLRRRQRDVVVTASAAGAFAVTGAGIVGVVGTSATTLEDQVAYLLRRDQGVQTRMSELDARLARFEGESPRRLDELRSQMEDRVARELADALEQYRPLRIAGTVALAVGLASVTVATLFA